MDAFSLEVLNLLDEGDIISHIYTGWPGSIIKPDGSVPHELKEALERGVVTDTAHGIPNLSFIIARQGIAQGILPTTISTDLASTNIDGPIFSLLLTMSKFLALGLSLNQVIGMTTINPARALREDRIRGTLNINTPADISILELNEGDFTFSDGWIGNTIKGKLLLLPHLTLKAGVEIIPRPGAKDEVG
jgi:dihydroorotase